MTTATATQTTKAAMIVRELPDDLRPESRARTLGFGALSNYELMQLVYSFKTMDTPVALMSRAGSLSAIAQMTLEEVQETPEIGPKAALAIKAAFELGRRMLVELPNDQLQIRSPADVANALMLEMGLLEVEHLRVLLLNTKNVVTAIETVYQGSLNTAVVRIAEVFRSAVRKNACSIIVVHNHPSGDPTPSPEDVRVTEMIVEAGKLLDIAVLDHVVIGRNRYVSLKERGLGFK